jgi:Asp-tRNA(Asn)/Glu-tRNA(Gln) amidotransferase A subunit family amidase
MGEAWAGFATLGPMARSVRDVATMLDVLHGPVVGDPYWAPDPVTSFRAACDISPHHLKIGMISKTSLTKVDAETIAALEAAAKDFEDMRHNVEPISADPGGRMRDIVMTLICAGVGSMPVADISLVDPVVRELWEAGQKMSAAQYIGIVTQMHNMAREVVQELSPYDCVISPVTSSPAVKTRYAAVASEQISERASGLDTVHFRLQRDRPAGVFGAERLQPRRPAAGAANCRTSGRRGDDYRAGGAIRKSASVEGQASEARLTIEVANPNRREDLTDARSIY